MGFVPFLPRSHIDKPQVLATLKRGRYLRPLHIDKLRFLFRPKRGGHHRRQDLKLCLHLLALTDAGDHRIQGVRDIVLAADLCQRIRRLVTAGGAPTNVVTPEQSQFGAGIGAEDFPHGGVLPDID